MQPIVGRNAPGVFVEQHINFILIADLAQIAHYQEKPAKLFDYYRITNVDVSSHLRMHFLALDSQSTREASK